MTAAAQPSVEPDAADRLSSWGFVLAGLNAGAGVIHFALVPAHSGGGLLDPVGFALAGWFQLALAGLLLWRGAAKQLWWVVAAGNAVAVALWVWSHTTGLPVGVHKGVAEDVVAVDAITVGLEAAAIVVALAVRFGPRVELPQLSSVVVGVAAVGLATVGVVTPEGGAAEEHSHADEESVAEPGVSPTTHGHDASGVIVPTATELESVDARRCDWAFNPASYWEEARRLGVDTYAGGTLSLYDDPAGDEGLDAIVASSPLDGQGSETLDRLVSLATQAVSEISATTLVGALADAGDEDYSAFLDWLEANRGGHTHASGSTSGGTSAAPEDTGGHGGHLGPQPWKAMVDQKACDQLAAELETAREIALRYPTGQDAIDAGWVPVTPYLPGIAAHYMNFRYVDGRFDLEEPEMLLYDGDSPDAHVLGLSYYIVLEGEAEPTQGFTGDSDHYHRHIGLCMRGAMVIGDSTMTAEECAAIGGVKADGSDGWMNHVWVVPGCESPWGVFSAANPLLDNHVGVDPTSNDGACAASAVLDRYDLSAGAAPPAPAEEVDGAASGKP